MDQGSYRKDVQNGPDCWVCPNDDTINTDDVCIICGYHRPNLEKIITGEGGTKGSPKKKKGLLIVMGITAIMLAAGLCWTVGNIDGKDTRRNAETRIAETRTTAKTEVEIENKKARNVLMTDFDTVFGSGITRDQVKSIVFLDTLKGATDTAWDVSEKQNGSVLAWVESNGSGYNLYIASDGGVRVGSCRALFSQYENVERIEFNDCFDTSGVADMSVMFSGCKALTALDVSGFDTSEVTDMSRMFSGCESLTLLDVGGFDTSKVTNMSGMFDCCFTLASLNLSNFDTAQVTKMREMFHACYALEELNVTSFDTSNVIDMSYMFRLCESLVELDLSGFVTSNVRDMNRMFYGCRSLVTLNVSSTFVISRAIKIEMFADCPNLSVPDFGEAVP